METRKNSINDNITQAAEAAVDQALRSKKVRRAQRNARIEKFVIAYFTELGFITLIAFLLMTGLDGFGVSAPYNSCLVLVVAARLFLRSALSDFRKSR